MFAKRIERLLKPSRIARTALLIALASVLVGCATTRPRGLADRFITPGEPAIEIGAAPDAPADTLGDYVAKLRHLSSAARPVSGPTGASSMEAADPLLRHRLDELAVSPTPAAHRRVAEAYHLLGIRDHAYKHLSAAVRLDPADATAYDARARLWREWGLPHLGLGDAHRATFHAPRSAAAWNTLGILLQESGRYDDARRAYERVLALAPAASYAWNNVCHLDLVQGRPGPAREACLRAIALSPGLKAAEANLAVAEETISHDPPSAAPPDQSGVSTPSADGGDAGRGLGRQLDLDRPAPVSWVALAASSRRAGGSAR